MRELCPRNSDSEDLTEHQVSFVALNALHNTPPARDVIAAFLDVARSYPDRPALIANGRELSYAQVQARARELAARLGHGCGAVAVMTARTEQTIIALLAVLLAGGVYCPIDPGYPVEQQRRIARIAGCTTVIAAGAVPVAFPELRFLDALESAAEPPGANAPAAPAADAPAYILFTSGSSGEPRPVHTPRRALAEAVRSLGAFLEIQPDDRVLQFASLSWDTCFEEIWPALTTGASLVIDDDAYSGSFPRFLRMLERQRITAIDLPTAFWHELVYFLAEEHRPLPPELRLVVIGGEAARPRRLADWCALDSGKVRLVNTYGCTETTLVTHAMDLHGPRASSPAARWVTANEVPIGQALPHVIERIREAGDDGELLIGGPALALGYFGAPDATGRRFQAFDFGAGPRRFFLTGDRVWRCPTGELFHRGRLDAQLKIRGIRVDPGEVEAEIASHAGVAAVAVVGTTVAEHTALIAYLVPRPGISAATLAADVAAYLRGRVAAHLVPSQLTVVPELAHTSSGKVDRAASHLRHSYATRRRRGQGDRDNER